MKRSQKKLTLHRETVRTLENVRAPGGNATGPTFNCSLVCPTWAPETQCPQTCHSTCSVCLGCYGTVIVPTG